VEKWTAAIAVWDGSDPLYAAVDASGRNELWGIVGDGSETHLERLRTLDPMLEARDVALGDLDGDAAPEIVIAHKTGLRVEWGNADPAANPLDLEDEPGIDKEIEFVKVAFLPLQAGAKPVLVAVRKGGIDVWSDGVDDPPTEFTRAGVEFRGVAAADLDGDGEIDLIGAHSAGVEVWPSADPRKGRSVLVSDDVVAVVAFDVDGDHHTVNHEAAADDPNVEVDHENDSFVLTGGGNWSELPLDGQQITVSGLSINGGSYTVSGDATATEIKVTADLQEETTPAAGITIRWTTEGSSIALDLVVAMSDQLAWMRNPGATGNFTFGLPEDFDEMHATSLAANTHRLVAGDDKGYRAWTAGGGPKGAFEEDRDGPAVDDVAIGSDDKIVLARSGAGNDVVGVGIFAYEADRTSLQDMDGDGDLDLVTTDVDRKNRVYWNSAGAFDSSTEVGYGFAEAGDLDLDGDLDLVTGTLEGRDIQVWWNEGGEFKDDGTVLRSGMTRGVRIAKLFGDRLPAIVAVAERDVIWFDNDGSGAINPEKNIAATAVRVLDLVVGHLNDDCRADLICGTSSGLQLFRAQSNRAFFPIPAPVTTGLDTRAILLGDFMINGRHDFNIVTAGRGRDIGLWSWHGGVIEDPNRERILDGNFWVETLASADVDSDGERDLFMGRFDARNELRLTSSAPDGATSDPFPKPRWSAIAAYPGSNWTNAVAVGDVDGDGDLDIVIHRSDGMAPEVHWNK
jgi:hypothetical protein